MKTEKGAVGGKAQELQQKQNKKRKLAVRRMTAELPQTHTVSYKLHLQTQRTQEKRTLS